jgi:sugar phosphate isomerase/epimerase
MTSRRTLLKSLALTPVALASTQIFAQRPQKSTSKILFSLNTSTLRGQKLTLPEIIEIAAKAGYDGIELWIEEMKTYQASGKSLSSLNKHFNDAGIKPVNAIGFAKWMAQNEAVRKDGFIQMESEMGMLSEIDCPFIAAPAIGASEPINPEEAGVQFAQLLSLGRKTGVMPLLEFWGSFPPFHTLSQCLAVAAAANDPDARILPDVYHLFRGGSGYEGLKLLSGQAIEILHMNDFTTTKPREEQKDSDRIYPGDGVAPLKEVAQLIMNMGGTKILSLELFNETYWKQDALSVASTGLEKMKQFF